VVVQAAMAVQLKVVTAAMAVAEEPVTAQVVATVLVLPA
jgi:hypothetical protein